MNILVLNGSPHPNGPTSDMVEAFSKGATEAGHNVETINVFELNIAECEGCEFCHRGGHNHCKIKDDMQELYPKILGADMLVFASPIYYFSLTAPLQAALHRTYNFGIPRNIQKTALILSSGASNVYDGAIYQYKNGVVDYWGVEDAGIFTAHGIENKSDQKRQELYEFGRSI